MARSRPELPQLPPALLALGALTVVLALIALWSIVSSSGSRREAVELRADLSTARTQLEAATTDAAELRQQLQTRAGEVDELRDRVQALESELADARLDADDAAQSAEDAAEASAQASEAAAAAEDLAQVTSLVTSTPGVTRALHITDVQDGNVLTGFDLADMLSGAPNAGESVQVRLALTDAPLPGDCRHTQSSSLTSAWLEATNHDVLLRQPAGAPQTDEDGRALGEVLAFVNPANSLNVTLVVAGEAIIDEDELEDDPDLAERLRVAQTRAEQSVRGVWGCSDSQLLSGAEPDADAAPDASASPSPGATPSATPSASASPPDG